MNKCVLFHTKKGILAEVLYIKYCIYMEFKKNLLSIFYLELDLFLNKVGIVELNLLDL